MDGSTPRIIAGIDIGGTNVRCALADMEDPRRILAWRRADTPVLEGPESLVALIETELDYCLREAGLDRSALLAAGCVAPGIVDSSAGTVRTAANLAGWSDVPLTALLENTLDVPVCLENDVNAAAMAEYRHGAGAGCHSLVYLTISTGVAVGIVVGGELLRGCHHAAGEIGYIIPESSFLEQRRDGNGCLERTAAGVGLAQSWANSHGGPAMSATAIQVFDAARDGHPDAVALVDRAADYMAMTTVALGAIVDPEILVLGGSIARNEPCITDRIRKVMADTLLYPPRIVDEHFTGKAPLMGALTMAVEHVSVAPAG